MIILSLYTLLRYLLDFLCRNCVIRTKVLLSRALMKNILIGIISLSLVLFVLPFETVYCVGKQASPEYISACFIRVLLECTDITTYMCIMKEDFKQISATDINFVSLWRDAINPYLLGGLLQAQLVEAQQMGNSLLALKCELLLKELPIYINNLPWILDDYIFFCLALIPIGTIIFTVVVFFIVDLDLPSDTSETIATITSLFNEL